MNRKTQIEITNIMFMHLIGIVGILTFTFLFLSLITGLSARAEGVSEETVYYNYGRRLISSSDCFAYNHVEVYYDGVGEGGSGISNFSRVMPGVIDMTKLLDYNHQNCLRYDLVSGAVFNDRTNPFATFPVVIYEVTVDDLVNNEVYFVKNDVYGSVASAQVYDICSDQFCTPGGKVSDCLFECSELRAYLAGELSIDASESLRCNIIAFPEGLGSVSKSSVEVVPGTNCWEKEFNDIARLVEPFVGDFDCSMRTNLTGGSPTESGKIFETSLQYFVQLKYPIGYRESVEHPGIFNVKFCVIKIPSLCDPFFASTTFTVGGLPVYLPEVCEAMGLVEI